jgi:hypothetical protein
MTSIEFLLEALTISPQMVNEIKESAEKMRQIELEIAKQQGIQEGMKIYKSLINPTYEKQ